MKTNFKGKVFKFGNNIDTDQIYPGRYLELVKPEDIKMHCMEGADDSFSQKVNSGDIVVGGTNFGCGSSREHAAIALKSSGVSVVIAESFARIFFRNATNLALPVIICKGISSFAEAGDDLSVDLKTGVIENNSKGTTCRSEKVSDHVMTILNSGGIKPLTKERVFGKKD